MVDLTLARSLFTSGCTASRLLRRIRRVICSMVTGRRTAHYAQKHCTRLDDRTISTLERGPWLQNGERAGQMAQSSQVKVMMGAALS